MKRVFSEYLISTGTVLLLGVFAYSLFVDWRRNERIAAIMNGPVRANRASGVYHVPTCPQYATVAGGNVRLFASIDDAESAHFRPALNCTDAIDIRSINETEQAEPAGAYEDPRQ